MIRLSARVLGFALLAAAPAQAGTQLITNGSFESSTSGGGQLGYNTTATDWTTSGYNFLFPSGSADSTGVTGQYGNLQLWGPGNGSANGLPASSPDGGNYVGADGAYDVGAISQTVNGLTVGAYYTLFFYWGAAQQYTYTGVTTEQWQVSLGGDTQTTSVASIASHGFSGWLQQTFYFKATSSSELLSFLAIGTPTGEPPFALLDGVSMIQVVPESSALSVLAVGLAALGWARRRREKSASF
jgi:hypothetical protein